MDFLSRYTKMTFGDIVVCNYKPKGICKNENSNVDI